MGSVACGTAAGPAPEESLTRALERRANDALTLLSDGHYTAFAEMFHFPFLYPKAWEDWQRARLAHLADELLDAMGDPRHPGALKRTPGNYSSYRLIPTSLVYWVGPDSPPLRRLVVMHTNYEVGGPGFAAFVFVQWTDGWQIAFAEFGLFHERPGTWEFMNGVERRVDDAKSDWELANPPPGL